VIPTTSMGRGIANPKHGCMSLGPPCPGAGPGVMRMHGARGPRSAHPSNSRGVRGVAAMGGSRRGSGRAGERGEGAGRGARVVVMRRDGKGWGGDGKGWGATAGRPGGGGGDGYRRRGRRGRSCDGGLRGATNNERNGACICTADADPCATPTDRMGRGTLVSGSRGTTAHGLGAPDPAGRPSGWRGGGEGRSGGERRRGGGGEKNCIGWGQTPTASGETPPTPRPANPYRQRGGGVSRGRKRSPL